MSTEPEEVTFQVTSAKSRPFKGIGRVLDVEYNEIITKGDKVISTRKITNKDKKGELVHESLLKSLKAFLPHFLLKLDRANINEFTPEYFSKKEYEKKKYDHEVTGVQIREFNGHNHVVMFGNILLKSNEKVPLTLPMIKYDFDPDNDKEKKYEFHVELKKAIDVYLTEVEKYLAGHHEVPAQTSMQNQLDGNVEEVDEEKPTKSSKKK